MYKGTEYEGKCVLGSMRNSCGWVEGVRVFSKIM